MLREFVSVQIRRPNPDDMDDALVLYELEQHLTTAVLVVRRLSAIWPEYAYAIKTPRTGIGLHVERPPEQGRPGGEIIDAMDIEAIDAAFVFANWLPPDVAYTMYPVACLRERWERLHGVRYPYWFREGIEDRRPGPSSVIVSAADPAVSRLRRELNAVDYDAACAVFNQHTETGRPLSEMQVDVTVKAEATHRGAWTRVAGGYSHAWVLHPELPD